MSPRTRLYVMTVLLSVGAAGCVPAHHVRVVRQAPARCEVRVCLNPHTSFQRCDCQTAQQTQRQLREAGWLKD